MTTNEFKSEHGVPNVDGIDECLGLLKHEHGTDLQVHVDSTAVMARVLSRRRNRRWAMRVGAIAVVIVGFTFIPKWGRQSGTPLVESSVGGATVAENRGSVNPVEGSVNPVGLTESGELETEIEALRSKLAMLELKETRERLKRLRMQAAQSDVRRIRREAAIAHVLARAEL